MSDFDELDLLSANVAIGEVGTQEIIIQACEWLATGCDSQELRDLAGADATDEADVLRAFDRILVGRSRSFPSMIEAHGILSRHVSREIVGGRIEPIEGARRIWRYSQLIDVNPPEVHPFIYAASEWDERPEMRTEFARGIIEAASELLAST